MRVVDLLFRYATPGTVVVDRTAARAELSNPADGAALGLAYERDPRGRLTAPRSLLLHTVLDPADPSPFASDLPTGEVVHVVFVERLDMLVEHGVLADAAERYHELIGIHQVRHRIGRFAAVLASVTDPARIPYLRVINEYRYNKLRVDELEATKGAREAELAKVRARLAQDDAERVELAKLRREVAWQKKRGDGLERQLAQMVKRLESARSSVSFRIGRATTLALKGARKDITAVPRRWLDGFRGKDEILEQARDELTKSKPAAITGPSAAPTAIELEMYRLGRPAAPPSRTGIAGIASPRFAAELAASAPFTTLVPHAWRAQLTDLPAYVLVTSDGLGPDGTWIQGGTIGGRDGETALRELTAWCRDRGVPAVYWDTIGGFMPPRDVHFDARFSVAPRSAPAGTELLAPAIEASLWKPDGAEPRAPLHAIYCGGFDRRGGLTVLEGALRAATGFGLQIFDPNHGIQGTFAESVRFPDGLASATRRRPAFDAERAAIAKAGALICAPHAASPDAPSWQLLRGLALGASVLACSPFPAAFADAVELATDEASAKAALGRMFARPRLDATWRQAYDHVLASYALGDRLDAIAQRVRSAPVAKGAVS